MSKKRTVKCAAANDDDFDFDFDEAPVKKSTRVEKAAEVNREKAEEPKKEKKEKKEKEFAWMESDDDADDDGEVEKEKEKEKDDEDEKNLDVSVAALDEVTTFGQMARLAPSLQAKLKTGRMEAADLAAAYRVLGRSKFFDGDLLDAMNPIFCRLLRQSRITDAFASDTLICLATLNAYDKEVFSAVARNFTSQILQMQPGLHHTWLQIFRDFGHDAEKDFLQLLEKPPMPPGHPGHKVIRCIFDSRGSCAVGASCTYSHDPRAPFTLGQTDAGLGPRNQVLTQCQLFQGRGAYTTQPLR